VFHVEHGFFQAWQRFKTALSQRNSALRAGQDKKMCQLWDRELAEMAVQIDNLRKNYLSGMQPILHELIQRFFDNKDVLIEYRRGWDNDLDLQQVLRQNFARDKKRGHTTLGPHRAELYIRIDGKSAQTGISRGQQKMLVALLRLAQAKHFSEANNRPCVLLYDDLPAELDSNHRDMVMQVIRNMRVQLFITSIEPEQVDITAWKHKKMFHVEQGKLTELV